MAQLGKLEYPGKTDYSVMGPHPNCNCYSFPQTVDFFAAQNLQQEITLNGPFHWRDSR